MKSLFAQRLSTSIAFVALAGILAFGGGIRYFCYCSGEVVVAAHDHCHGVHVDEGPVDHAPAGHRHDHDGGRGDSGDHGDHRHERVKSSTDLRLPDVVATPAAKPLSPLWSPLSQRAVARVPEAVIEISPPSIEESPPLLSHRVARAIVRLI